MKFSSQLWSIYTKVSALSSKNTQFVFLHFIFNFSLYATNSVEVQLQNICGGSVAVEAPTK